MRGKERELEREFAMISSTTKRKHSQCFEWSHEIRFYAGLLVCAAIVGWIRKWWRLLYAIHSLSFRWPSLEHFAFFILKRSTVCFYKARTYRTVESSIYNENIFFLSQLFFLPSSLLCSCIQIYCIISTTFTCFLHKLLLILPVQFTHNQFRTFRKWIKFI